MIHNEVMSENLVDDFKNLIPFFGGGFDIDWKNKQPASYYNSSNPMTMDVNHGKLIVDCHLTNGQASQFSISKGVYILHALADGNADNVASSDNNVSMDDKFRVYPALLVVFDEIMNFIFEAPIISCGGLSSQYSARRLYLYCSDFNILVLRVA